MKTYELYNPLNDIVYQLVAAESPVEALKAAALSTEIVSFDGGVPHLVDQDGLPYLDIYARETAA